MLTAFRSLSGRSGAGRLAGQVGQHADDEGQLHLLHRAVGLDVVGDLHARPAHTIQLVLQARHVRLSQASADRNETNASEARRGDTIPAVAPSKECIPAGSERHLLRSRAKTCGRNAAGSPEAADGWRASNQKPSRNPARRPRRQRAVGRVARSDELSHLTIAQLARKSNKKTRSKMVDGSPGIPRRSETVTSSPGRSAGELGCHGFRFGNPCPGPTSTGSQSGTRGTRAKLGSGSSWRPTRTGQDGKSSSSSLTSWSRSPTQAGSSDSPPVRSRWPRAAAWGSVWERARR